MHRLGFIAYLFAALRFLSSGQSAGALLAVGLLGWAVALDLLAGRATWAGPTLDQSGYGTGLRQRDVDYLSGIDRLAFMARFLSIALGAFGPLLLLWSLL